jgi:hypothetical protein
MRLCAEMFISSNGIKEITHKPSFKPYGICVGGVAAKKAR